MNRLSDIRETTARKRLSRRAWVGRAPDPSRAPGAQPERNRVLEEELASLRRQRDSLQRALSDAAQVQRRLSGPRSLRRGDFEIVGENFASQHVSGDLLTAFDLGERTVFAIGDICGKGLFAAMWFTHLAGMVRIFAGACADPAGIAAAIHNHLISLQPEPPLATLFVGILHAGTSELIYCNAGHPDPLWLRADGGWEQLSVGGPLLGALPAAVYLNGRIALASGETLIAYSDGVVEQRNRSGEDFEPERLAMAARSAGGNSANSILFSVLGATQDFAAAQPRLDDISLLVVHRRAREGAQAAS